MPSDYREYVNKYKEKKNDLESKQKTRAASSKKSKKPWVVEYKYTGPRTEPKEEKRGNITVVTGYMNEYWYPKDWKIGGRYKTEKSAEMALADKKRKGWFYPYKTNDQNKKSWEIRIRNTNT
jgi:hypothetical protein